MTKTTTSKSDRVAVPSSSTAVNLQQNQGKVDASQSTPSISYASGLSKSQGANSASFTTASILTPVAAQVHEQSQLKAGGQGFVNAMNSVGGVFNSGANFVGSLGNALDFELDHNIKPDNSLYVGLGFLALLVFFLFKR